MSLRFSPIVSKSPDGILRVVAIGRVSTPGQNIENIQASYEYNDEFLRRIYSGPMNVRYLGERGSGMLVERETIQEAEALIDSGQIDLVIAEDLSRMYRNPRYQYAFVQNAVDMGTRVICVGDALDTADENWEVALGAAALRHGLYIPDTRRRVRRTAIHSFHQGGMVQKVRFGYRKLSVEEAASGQFGPPGLRIAKLPECTPILCEIKDRILAGSPYAAVAEWLEAEGIQPGPYATNGRWTGKLVVETLEDPLLSGLRTFRDTICEPIYRTGKHRSRRNVEPETEHCPSLAHLTREEHQELLAEIARRRERYPCKRGRENHRYNIPRRRSTWPGQAVQCAVCGGLMHVMGPHLKCQNCLPRSSHACWNHVQVPVALVRDRVLEWLVTHVDEFTGLKGQLIDAAWQELERAQRLRIWRDDDLGRQIAPLEEEAKNLARAIAQGGDLEALVNESHRVDALLKELRKKQAIQASKSVDSASFDSRADVENRFPEALTLVARTSFGFADLLRTLFPKVLVQPVQALDTCQVRPRGKLTFRPPGAASKQAMEQDTAEPTEDITIVLDFFKTPEHIENVPPCRSYKAEHPHHSLKRVAAAVGIGPMTVKRAMDYARRMEREGLSEPYRELHEAPEEASRWKPR
jgi:DNA invertase Pin-like site-specific DNA recombinase